MEKTFYVSRLCLIKEWDNEVYSVKASSKEEALEKFIKANEKDSTDIDNEEDITFVEQIPIYETVEDIQPVDDEATIEIYNDKNILKWDNTHGRC